MKAGNLVGIGLPHGLPVRKVPTDATAAQFLASQFTRRTDFTATGSTWTFVDPMTFVSSGATYYRAVAR